MKAGKKGRMAALAAVIAVASALLIHAWLHPARPPSFPPLPNPNGYDDFVAAGGMFTPRPGDWSDLDQDHLRAAVVANSNAFNRIRLGLSRQCRVPTEEEIHHLGRSTVDLPNLKSIASALPNKGRLAETEGRPFDAANDYVTIFQVASKSGHGGFLIHSMVQVAMETYGAKNFGVVIPNLSAQESRQCLAALQKAETDRETFANIEAAELIFGRFNGSLRERAWDSILQFLGKSPTQAIIASTYVKYTASDLKILALETQLASHAFQLERGRPASSWSDLVPEYLPAIPVNPTNHQPLAFPP